MTSEGTKYSREDEDTYQMPHSVIIAPYVQMINKLNLSNYKLHNENKYLKHKLDDMSNHHLLEETISEKYTPRTKPAMPVIYMPPASLKRTTEVITSDNVYFKGTGNYTPEEKENNRKKIEHLKEASLLSSDMVDLSLAKAPAQQEIKIRKRPEPLEQIISDSSKSDQFKPQITRSTRSASDGMCSEVDNQAE